MPRRIDNQCGTSAITEVPEEARRSRGRPSARLLSDKIIFYLFFFLSFGQNRLGVTGRLLMRLAQDRLS